MRVAPSRPLARLRRFRRSEDGSMVVFGLFLFVMMLIVAGLAVDVMRFETNRARLQRTLDRAVLAAAELDQVRDCEDVVESYFEAAGMLDQLDDVGCIETINSREVSADAKFALNSLFMDWVGVEQLVAPAAGTAEEAVSDIEIVLVLDVSGSMGEASGGSTKIALLRSAAREFVSTVRQNDTDDRVSIAIVPFNAQVNLGPTIFNGMAGDGWSSPNDANWDIIGQHGVVNSFCLDLPDDAYGQAGIPRMRSPAEPLELPQSGYFDGVSGTTRNHNAYTASQPISTGNVFCRTEPSSFVRLPSQDVTTMREQLDDLVARGNTSITMGMKWANFMLDPSTRPFLTAMVDAAQMPETLRGRPFDYDRPDTRKIVVVMTDGDHVPSLYLNPGFRTELSPIFMVVTGTSSIQYSILLQPPARTALGAVYQPYRYWVPNLNIDGSATTAVWPTLPRDGLDNDFDGVVDDGIVGGWRVTPWDGTSDEDVDGVTLPVCDDDDNDGRDDGNDGTPYTGAQPCDDDDLNDDGRDDGENQDGDSDVDGVVGPPRLKQLYWHEVWQNLRVSWVAWNLYARGWCGTAGTSANNTCRNTTYAAVMNTRATAPFDGALPRFMSATEVSRMNSTLQQSCAQARSNRVEIYGIAFEAPPSGEQQIFDCASSPSHFYDAEGLDVAEAFEAIAAQINALRLSD